MEKTHTFVKDIQIQKQTIFTGNFMQVTLTKLLFQNINFKFRFKISYQDDQYLKIFILLDLVHFLCFLQVIFHYYYRSFTQLQSNARLY